MVGRRNRQNRRCQVFNNGRARPQPELRMRPEGRRQMWPACLLSTVAVSIARGEQNRFRETVKRGKKRDSSTRGGDTDRSGASSSPTRYPVCPRRRGYSGRQCFLQHLQRDRGADGEMSGGGGGFVRPRGFICGFGPEGQASDDWLSSIPGAVFTTGVVLNMMPTRVSGMLTGT